MRVFLVGFMGAGKSAVGPLLAEARDSHFVELDDEVARGCDRTVAEIFEHWGEPRFRWLEAEALRSTSRWDDVVVATGGGTPLDPANRAWMEAQGVSVWLDTPWEVILSRVDPESRPLWRSPEEARALFEERQGAYGEASVRVSVDGRKGPAQVARKVSAELDRLVGLPAGPQPQPLR